MFVDYDSSSKGYKLYKKVMFNHDVEFDEEMIWNWEAQEEKHMISFIL